MNRNQIERFIRKIYPYEPVKLVYFYNKSPESCWGEVLYSKDGPEIRLNLFDLRKKKSSVRKGLWTKALLLHEIAHIILNRNYGRECWRCSLGKWEFHTHLYAIEIAEKFKMWQIRKALVYIIRKWEKGEEENHQRYREAYKLSLKNKKMISLYE